MATAKQRMPIGITLLVWGALSIVAAFWLWQAVLSYQQGDWDSLTLIAVVFYLPIAPTRYDPAIWLKQRMMRPRSK